jgi:AraC-like DNA-binding protein
MIPLYLKTYEYFKTRELIISQTLLQNGIARFDSSINSLTSLVHGLFTENRYLIITKPYGSIQLLDYYDVNIIQKDFQWAIASQTLITDCGIIFRNKIALTRFRTFIDGNYYGSFFTVTGKDMDAWHDLISESEKPILIPRMTVWSYDYGHYDALLWTSPVLESVTSSQRGVFYGMIDIKNLLNLMMPQSIQSSGYLLVRDRTGAILLNHQFNGSDEGYITYEGYAESAGLSFQIGIPNALFANQLAPLRHTVLIYFALALLLGIVLSVYFAWRNNRPVRLLVNSVSDSRIPARFAEERHVNALDYVNRAIIGMNITLDESDSMILKQKEMMKQNHFEKCLFGMGMPESESLHDFLTFFPSFPDRYQLALIRLNGKTAHSPDVRISRQLLAQQFLTESFPHETYIQSIDGIFFVLVLSVNSDDDTNDRWYRYLDTLNQTHRTEDQYALRIALSCVFSGQSQLQIAFAQVRHVMQLSGQANEKPVWQPADFPGHEARLPFDFSHMQQLYSALLTGRVEYVDSIINTAYDRIHSAQHLDELFYQQILYNLRGVLLRIKMERFDILSDIEIIIQTKNVDFTAQLALIRQCCQDICSRIYQTSTRDTYTDRLLGFINKNLCNPDFYSRTVTQEFGISFKKMSRLIHQATGKAFFEYVEEHRIDKAIKLLNSSSMSVSEVAHHCGFSSYNSLYKAFRRKYKIAPGSLKEKSAQAAVNAPLPEHILHELSSQDQ